MLPTPNRPRPLIKDAPRAKWFPLAVERFASWAPLASSPVSMICAQRDRGCTPCARAARGAELGSAPVASEAGRRHPHLPAARPASALRSQFTCHSGSLALAALSLTALAGCSASVPALPPYEGQAGQAPVVLAIAGPHEELIYSTADDDDLQEPGIQIVLRVDVQDERIMQVHMAVNDGAASDDVVAEDLAGRRAAFFPVTLAGVDTPLMARAVLEGTGPIEVQAVLRAVK